MTAVAVELLPAPPAPQDAADPDAITLVADTDKLMTMCSCAASRCTDESRVSWLSQVVDGWFSRVRIDRFPGSGPPLFACPGIRQAATQGRNRAR